MSESEKAPGSDFPAPKTSKPLIAVTMATSRQGRAVVNHLSENGCFRVRAITRDPSCEEAEKLSKLANVEVFKGNLLDKNSLKKCFKDAYGIFGNTTPTKGWMIFRGSMDKKYELAQGRNLIQAVKEVSKEGALKQFVFSSVCKAKDPLKNVPIPGHFSSKWMIEDFIELNDLKSITTIFRPVSYFENFNTDIPGLQIDETSFPGIIKENKIWQTIAVDDIGLWTSAAFNYPKKFIGKAFNIAGEEMTGSQMVNIFNNLNKRKNTKYFMLPRSIIRLIEHDIAVMANWIECTGYGADISNLKTLASEVGIKMTSLSEWLQENYLKKERLKKDKNLSIAWPKFQPTI